jgi:hypothetical protein
MLGGRLLFFCWSQTSLVRMELPLQLLVPLLQLLHVKAELHVGPVQEPREGPLMRAHHKLCIFDNNCYISACALLPNDAHSQELEMVQSCVQGLDLVVFLCVRERAAALLPGIGREVRRALLHTPACSSS